MNFKGKGAYVVYVTAFEMKFDTAKIVIIFQLLKGGKMKNKYYNDAIIGNKNIKATISKKGELLRLYYPNIDFKQFIDTFHIGIKVNDSSIIYLHEDINNRYYQYYTEDTNILNTEIENTYFNLNIRQTDFATIKNNLIIRKYVFANNNKIDLKVNFVVYSKLLTNSNNMISGKVIEDGLIQYNHDFSFAIFSNLEINGHRINNVDSYIRDGVLSDKDYIGMSNASGITYDLETLKPGEQKEFFIAIYVKNNREIKKQDGFEEEIESLKKLDVAKEYSQTKKYWKSYVEKHIVLPVKDNKNVNENAMQIYKRTILLFPLLQNEETGGISATAEVDEEREKSGRYSYSWPRDSVFITKALDLLGMTKETNKFYDNFCKKTQSRNGMWEQRFYADGTLAPCWGYQIDETASVIYGLYEHYKVTKEKKFLENNLKMCENAMHFLFKYLEYNFNEEEKQDLVKKEIQDKIKEEGREKDHIYKHKSYDLWEMNEGIHLYSLASIYSAFTAMKHIYEETREKFQANRLKIEQIEKNIVKMNKEQENIKKFIQENMYDENQKVLHRNCEDSKMDISIMGAVYPFEVFSPTEKVVTNTVEKINMTLRTYTGGYLRFEQDRYMGGTSPWPVTTLWMAMYYLKCGDKKRAKECFNFVTNSSSNLGFLAEQVDKQTMKPSWVIGLGWSHAMYIILLAELLKESN